MVDVQIPYGWTATTVLTLELIANHQITTSEPNGDTRGAFIAKEMQDAWDADVTSDDGQPVVARTHGHVQPSVEIVRFTGIVERPRAAPIHEDHRSPHRGDAHGRKMAIQKQYR